MRDRALERAPLEPAHVRRVNRAEAEVYRRVGDGVSLVDSSDRVLGFDCGGSQWVYEVAHPAGTLGRPSFADLDFVEALLGEIEGADVAAPAPIEQVTSRVCLSSKKRHCWVYCTWQNGVL
jgi:L-galactono-1,4-lactone dehydrogenase